MGFSWQLKSNSLDWLASTSQAHPSLLGGQLQNSAIHVSQSLAALRQQNYLGVSIRPAGANPHQCGVGELTNGHAWLRIGDIVAQKTEVVSSDFKPRTGSVMGRHCEYQILWPSVHAQHCLQGVQDTITETAAIACQANPSDIRVLESACQATNACIRNVVMLKDDFSERDVASKALR